MHQLTPAARGLLPGPQLALRGVVGVLAWLILGVASLGAQTTVDFESLVVDGAVISNHTGFSATGIENTSGAYTFQYTVNGGGSLKYVRSPGALYIGYRRSAPVTSFKIIDDAETFIPHAMTLTNPFYLAGALQVGLRGYLDDVNTPVWTDTITVGSAVSWENITIDLQALAPPELHRMELVPVIPAGDLYFYLESWAYVAPTDTDNDGLVDSYDDDDDNDGYTDVEEIDSGTDPTDAGDFPTGGLPAWLLYWASQQP